MYFSVKPRSNNSDMRYFIDDEIKNKYCEQHKIKLIRIPHTQRDNITLQLLELEEYIL